jgi:hypothetical protein
VLTRLVGRLAPGGAVVACIPNIGPWSVVQGLREGSWTYRASGLLDRTHLRFFTLESAQKLLTDAGLVVRKVKSRDFPLDAAAQEKFLAAMKGSLQSLAGDAALAEARLKALQYVLVAEKPPEQPLLVVHQAVMVRELLEARVAVPWAALGSIPSLSPTMSERAFNRLGVASGVPKVAVIQRQLVGDLERWLAFNRQLIADGWVTVAEWDDHPELLPEPAHQNWLRHPWLPMSAMHACQVSTPRLAEAFREHNPEVAVFENALAELPPLPEKDPSRIRIVYAAVNRPGVARLISTALDAAALDPRVELVFVGDEKVFASTRAERKTLLPLQPYAKYLDLLATADIALLPLKGMPAELFKSPLKFMECASRGALCIASPDLYSDVIEHGRNGLIARAPHEWTTLLLRAVSDADERRAMARAGWETVRDRHLQAHHLQRRVDWYRDIAARREELTAALLERHPEMRP